MFRGKEEKARKVLALIAKLNCKPLPSGRLVTTEEKEQLLKERTQSTSTNEELESTTAAMLEDETETINSNRAINGTLPHTRNVEMTDLTATVSSDNGFDSELLLNENMQ